MQTDGASTLNINGGELYVRTEGDGVDSNGTFEMTGGTLIVMGPTSGANGSLDVNGSAVITGGTVIMAGASGMATNFTGASQGAIFISSVCTTGIITTRCFILKTERAAPIRQAFLQAPLVMWQPC